MRDCNGLVGLSGASALFDLADTGRVGADREGSAELDRNIAGASANAVGTQRPRAEWTIKASGSGATHDARTASEHLAP